MDTWEQIKKEYIEEEKKRWHFVKCPDEAAGRVYILTDWEKDNRYCAVFDGSYQFQGITRCDSKEIIKKERYIDGTYFAYACRFIQVGTNIYDLYNPSEILRIPIPEIWFDEKVKGIPTYYLKQHGYWTDPVDYEPQDIDVLYDLWNDDSFWDKINSILVTKGESAAIEEANRLSHKACKENGVALSQEVINEETRENISLMKMPSPSPVVSDLLNKRDNKADDNEHKRNELADFMSRRVTDCFEPSLILPLCYIAINLGISERDPSQWERIVAQVVAVGEEAYAQYLNEELPKMKILWQEGKAFSYGLSLREWVVNSREYKWLCGYFPKDTPKSKGAYTTAKRKKTQLYMRLKRLAAEKGYELLDNM